MFDQPVVVVKGGNSILDFLDDGLMRFSNNRVCFGAVNALQVLEDTPANVVIMEMDAGEMTGFELAEAIRDIFATLTKNETTSLISSLSARLTMSETNWTIFTRRSMRSLAPSERPS